MFVLRSENYSSGSGVYPTNLDCTYFVRKNSTKVCYLELSFIRFDVEASAQCQFDYLEINNVRLCGSLAKETTRTYIFEGSEKLIKFHSDASTSRTGFVIKVDQLECEGDVIIRPKPLLSATTKDSSGGGGEYYSVKGPVTKLSTDTYPTKGIIPSSSVIKGIKNNSSNIPCNQFFMSATFEIRSPGFPASFPVNSDCMYYIKKNGPNVCRLEVTYHTFSMDPADPSSAHCKKHFLDFNGVRMCGSLPSGEVRHYYFPDNEFKMRFVSNDDRRVPSSQHHSFRIFVRQLDCDINSIGSSNVKSLTNPTHTLSLPPVSTTTASSVHSSHPANCPDKTDNDITSDNRGEITSNETLRFPPVSTTNLRDLPPSPVSPSSPANCDRTFNDITFEIKSPNYPSGYERDTNCKYVIIKARGKQDPVCQLEIHFLDFELPSSSEDCSLAKDYVSFDAFGRLCSSMPAETANYFPFDGNTFTISLRSEDSSPASSNRFKGFHMKIRQRECPPKDVVSGTKPTFQSMQPSHGIKGLVSSKTSPDSMMRPWSQHDVYQGMARQPQQVIHQEMVPSTQCGQMISETDFEVRSPFYPSSYSENVECVYTIRKNNPSVCSVELGFIDFDVEDSNHCSKDYLLMDGKKFCGRYKPNTFMTLDFSSINEKILYFKSDENISRRGFSIIGRQKICPVQHFTGQVTSSVIGVNDAESMAPPSTRPNYPPSSAGFYSYLSPTIGSSSSNPQSSQSPPSNSPSVSICEYCFTDRTGIISSYNFPGNYPSNLDCKYKFTPLPSHCSLEIIFEEFLLETERPSYGSSCLETDFLEVDGMKYCFDQLRGQKKVISMTREPVIRFMTNSKENRQGPGFRASFTQMPCDMSSRNSAPASMSTPTSVSSYSTEKNGLTASASSSPSFSSPQSVPLYHSVSSSVSLPDSGVTSIASGNRINVLESGQTPSSSISSVDREASSSSLLPRVPCDLVIYDMMFDISSPGYPYGYPVNSDCLFSVRKLNNKICSLVLHFMEFDLEESVKCTGDSLEINEEDKLCTGMRNGTQSEYHFHNVLVQSLLNYYFST